MSQEYSVLSIVGVHANEELQSIFDRKRKDIDVCGKTYWMISVSSCLAAKINEVCAVEKAGIPILFLGAGIGKARPTTREMVFHGILNADAAHISFPPGLSEVTGKPGNTAYALELSAIDLCGEDRMLDTWNYEDLLARTRNESVKFRLGYSTAICMLIAPVPGMKSRMRKVIAMGQVLGCYKLCPEKQP